MICQGGPLRVDGKARYRINEMKPGEFAPVLTFEPGVVSRPRSHQSWADSRYANSFAGQFRMQTFGEASESKFAGA